MSSWMNVYDGVFFISITTLITGFLGLSIKYCLKSKCENFTCCFGLFKIVRRVDLEVQNELAMMEMGLNKENEGKEEKESELIMDEPKTPKSAKSDKV